MLHAPSRMRTFTSRGYKGWLGLWLRPLCDSIRNSLTFDAKHQAPMRLRYGPRTRKESLPFLADVRRREVEPVRRRIVPAHNPSAVNYTLRKTPFAEIAFRARIKFLAAPPAPPSPLCRIVDFAGKQDLGICPMRRKI